MPLLGEIALALFTDAARTYLFTLRQNTALPLRLLGIGVPLTIALATILMIMLFLLGEGPAMMNRLRTGAGRDNPRVERLTTVGRSVVRQFGLRAIVNLVTGAGVTVLLFLLGVDFPLLWGILTFILSFVPYIGLVLAVTPAVVLALAEFGVSRAVLVIVGVVVINVLAENVLSPVMMDRGLNISPTIVFLSFIVWAWLLGGPGAFMALPITLFVAVMLDTFPETRWLASLMGISNADAGAADDAADAPTLDGGPDLRHENTAPRYFRYACVPTLSA